MGAFLRGSFIVCKCSFFERCSQDAERGQEAEQSQEMERRQPPPLERRVPDPPGAPPPQTLQINLGDFQSKVSLARGYVHAPPLGCVFCLAVVGARHPRPPAYRLPARHWAAANAATSFNTPAARVRARPRGCWRGADRGVAP